MTKPTLQEFTKLVHSKDVAAMLGDGFSIDITPEIAIKWYEESIERQIPAFAINSNYFLFIGVDPSGYKDEFILQIGGPQ